MTTNLNPLKIFNPPTNPTKCRDMLEMLKRRGFKFSKDIDTLDNFEVVEIAAGIWKSLGELIDKPDEAIA